MRFVAIFEDTPAMAAVRREREAMHIEYLRTHCEEIVIGGGLREEQGGPFVGGLWVLDVASKERAVQLVEGDPYFQVEKRPYKLHVWGKALPDRQVVL
jgi:uncharacterized protein YciI